MALFLIAATAVMISQFSTSFHSKDSSLRRSCESYTNSLVGLVREETPFRDIVRILSDGTTTNDTPSFATDTRALPRGEYTDSPAIRFLVNYNPSSSARGPFIQNFQQIQGSIRTLSAIYNRYPALRCQFADYARLNPDNTNSLPTPTEFSNLPGKGFTDVKFRIEPFDLRTGNSLCAPILPKAYARPSGLLQPNENAYVANSGSPNASPDILALYEAHDESDPDRIANPYYTFDPSPFDISGSTIVQAQIAGSTLVGDPNLGFRFSAQMSYKVENQDYSCISTEEFAYPKDLRQPPAPDRALVASIEPPNSSTGIWDMCGGRPIGGDATLEVGYTAALNRNTIEPGTQFVCKDLSWIRTPRAVPPGPAYIQCMLPGGGTVPQPYFSPTIKMNTSNDYTNAQFPFNPTFLSSKHWEPCHVLKQCGVSPSVTVHDSGNDFYYELAYANLPFGCHLNFEVVAVDTAGNRSQPSAGGFLENKVNPPSVTIAGSTFASRNNEIYYPTCGNADLGTYTPYDSGYKPGLGYYCKYDSSWDPYYSTYTKGYYTCRPGGCCQGAGCSPSSM